MKRKEVLELTGEDPKDMGIDCINWKPSKEKRQIIAGRLLTWPTKVVKELEGFKRCYLMIEDKKTGKPIELCAEGALADVCCEYLRKGQLIAVEGNFDNWACFIIENMQMLEIPKSQVGEITA